MSVLHSLARAAGILIDWQDAAGRPQRVSDESLRRVLTALGYPAGTDAETTASLDLLRASQAGCAILSADAGQPLRLPPGVGGDGGAELLLEDGSTLDLSPVHARDALLLPPVAQSGYHRLRIGGREFRLAVAPRRCFSVGDAVPGRRPWGATAQIPSLRDARATAFGDLGSVAATARALAAKGADALGISPIHALFPADASRFSPYAPSSRLFLNILFGDPGLIGHPPAPGDTGGLIDWQSAIPARLDALRRAFAGRDQAVRDAVAAFAEQGGDALRHQATYDALHAHYFPQGARGWQDWPQPLRDPLNPAVARFAQEHVDEVEFFTFAQWLAERSLAAAQAAARDAGMAIGLISDLAVGMDGGGSHGWSRRDELLTGLSVGAPPDLLGPDGQNWGITGFSPFALRATGYDGFIRTLRAAMSHAGGIRIDHALGLRRLWVIPHGASSAEGAYLTFPMDEMLRILAIESHRAKAIVIGEDLGTVPEGLRPALEAREVLGMRVLWFERDEEGGFTAPESWSRRAAAMTSTHDLPTVAGWWRGRDLDWNERLKRGSQAEDRARRDEDRARLWQAIRSSGAARDERPPPDDPAPVADAALAHVAKAACELALVPMEDIAGCVEQPNLPGTMDEHPNWRRRMADDTASLLDRTDVAARLARLNAARRP